MDINNKTLARIPFYMRESLLAYVKEGQPPSGFLRAVLENDLKQACVKADGDNKYVLYDYVYWLYNYAPIGCWGSPKAVDEWLNLKREERQG